MLNDGQMNEYAASHNLMRPHRFAKVYIFAHFCRAIRL